MTNILSIIRPQISALVTRTCYTVHTSPPDTNRVPSAGLTRTPLTTSNIFDESVVHLLRTMHLNFADRVAGKASTPSQPTSTTSAAPAAASKASSLARAFTTSGKNKDKEAVAMGRASSQRAPLRPSQISLPVALISTTNMLSYDAPDLPHAPLKKQQQIQQQHQMSGAMPTRKASTVSSATSDSSSVRSRHSNASHTTAATSLSVEGYSPESPEQNHLSCYFKPPGSHLNSSPPPPHSRISSNTHYASRTDSLVSNNSYTSSPQVPSRATSHSMKAHVLSHKRSVSRVGMSSRHDSVASRDSEVPASVVPHAPSKTNSSHPFGKELAQLNEIAEEFSSTVRDAEQHADLRVLQSKGLGNFCATEYMAEIAPLFTRAYGDDLAASTPAWI